MVPNKNLLYKIFVKGRVQGVGFRWIASNEAKKRGINGLVRNLSDGTVYIEAEGPEEQLNAYVDWCRKSPGFSFVESVETESCPPVNYPDFRIEH
jgi:acylphosphatase